MTKFEKYDDGKPCWFDQMVDTQQQREDLIKFYDSLFGWQAEVGPEETGYYTTIHHDGNAIFGLANHSGSTGLFTLYFATRDINASIAKAGELGAQIFMPPMQVYEHGHMALAQDPSGVTHGFWQAIEFTGFGRLFEANAPSWFDHNSQNWQAASDYYAKLLNMTIMTPHPGGAILHRGDEWIASVSQQDDAAISPHWRPVFMVPDMPATRAKAKKIGATIVVEEQQVPGSVISVIKDPVVGNLLTIM